VIAFRASARLPAGRSAVSRNNPIPIHPMRLARLLLLALGLLACACSERRASPKVLRFTAIPDNNTTELREKFEPLAAHLSEVLGVPVEYVPTADYAASVETFKNADVLLAWFGGLTGAQARAAVPGARAIAQGKVDPKFLSYFVANADTGLTKSAEFPMGLEGKRFTFGSDSSTSGRLMPEHYIRQNTKKSPEEFFGHANAYSGGHDKTALLVESGAFDAGALNYKTYDEMVAAGKLDPERCRIVWVTPPYPDYNWTAHPALDEDFGAGFTDKVRDALLAIDDPALLAAVQRPEGLIAATNEDFEPIRVLAEQLDFIR